MSLSTVFLLSAGLSLCAAAPAASAPSATIDSGVIVGTASSLPSATVTVNQFLGVPFAQPPVGQNRFSEPQSPASWSTPLMTTGYAPACIQQFNYPAAARNFTIDVFDTPGPASESEDCLYLNVYVPNTPTKDKVVMFWIYGGSLQFGSNAVRAYDGTSFAANQDVIIVEPNYRTNIFGFPGAPELPLTGRNLGFLDQRLALDWVQRNIAAFGGDPTKVTLFGESAGAASVDELVTTMPDNPPFRGAIMESGQTSFYVNHNSTNTYNWDIILAELNCSTSADTLSCVRAADAETIESIVEHLALTFAPITDNVTQLYDPEAARSAGNIAKVPVMTGTNSQEGRAFVVGQNNTLGYLTAAYPALPLSFWEEVLTAYEIGSPGIPDNYSQISAIFTDLVFQCPSSQLANDSTTAGIPTWRYLFNASFPDTQPYPGLGVYHSSEIPIVFGTYAIVADDVAALTGTTPPPPTAYEMRLSEFMQTAWATFARNPMGGPGWAEYPNVAVLGGGNIGVDAGYGVNTNPGVLEMDAQAASLDQRCAFYQAIYAALGT